MGAIIPAAAPAFGAFGSADMLASLAPSILGEAAASSTLPALIDPLITNGLWDGVGAVPNTIESAGLSFLNGKPQNFGAKMSLLGDKLNPGEWDWMKGLDYQDALKLMQPEASQNAQQGPQNVQNNAPMRQAQGGEYKSFLDIIKEQQDNDYMKRMKYAQTFGRA